MLIASIPSTTLRLISADHYNVLRQTCEAVNLKKSAILGPILARSFLRTTLLTVNFQLHQVCIPFPIQQ